MNKTNNPPHKPSNGLRKNKILLGVFVPLGLLAFCGAGVGIGYAIGHKNTPTFSFSTTQPLLTKAGETFEVLVKTNNSSQKNFCMEIDATYDELFNGPSPFLEFIGENYIHDNTQTTTFHTAPFINKEAKFTIECMKPLEKGEDAQFIEYHLLHFGTNNPNPNYSQFGHIIFQNNEPQMSSEEINNYQLMFEDEWPDGKPSTTTFLDWLSGTSTPSAAFAQYFPKITDESKRISFNPTDSDTTVLDRLHMYDNSASILGIIMCDLYNCLRYDGSNSSKVAYRSVGVNVFGLICTTESDETESDKYGTETQKFNLALQQKSNITGAFDNEITNDIFMTKDQNIGSNWQIKWDSWLEYYWINGGATPAWRDKGGATGTFNGMKDADSYSGTGSLKMELKVIYKNVVKDWPTGW